MHAGVVGVAGKGEFVDVGGAAMGPVVVGVVDLALVGGHGAFGFRAAAVGGDERQSLIRGREAAVTSHVQGSPVVVEQYEDGVAVFGHGQRVPHLGGLRRWRWWPVPRSVSGRLIAW